MDTMIQHELVDPTPVSVRNYRDGDQALLADLINATDEVDQVGYRTTPADIQHEWDDPGFTATEDGFIAVVETAQGSYAVAMGDVYRLNPEDDAASDVTIHCWHMVRPDWRGTGIGSHIIEQCFARAVELAAEADDPRPKLFRVGVNAADRAAHGRVEAFGMECARTFYRMEYAPLNGALPDPEVPTGLRIVPWAEPYDRATMEAFNESFRDHWGFREVSAEMWRHWFHGPKSQTEYWRLAIDDGTGEVAGLCIPQIDADQNAALGRHEGWIRDLAVRRPWRKRGLGTALLLAGMKALRDAGMTSVRLGVDSDSLTNATRLYERVGYCTVHRLDVYLKPIEVA